MPSLIGLVYDAERVGITPDREGSATSHQLLSDLEDGKCTLCTHEPSVNSPCLDPELQA